MIKIEILAPAGSYESMRAAMNAGCDAVYMGGTRFGARAYADNPDEDTLIKAIEEAHLRGKRLYMTVNTLVKEEERQKLLYDYLEKYYLAGLDAVIVQDVGVMRFIHRHFPDLPIHASTQTTITMAQGADFLKSIGVTRLVTARELSFKEIKSIRDNTDMEIETFVHGALCYCYSGQCLMSSMIGGRSGNRGRCAQPCRMPYRFYAEGRQIDTGKEPYLLSPKDINTVALIPDLIESGVNSFKIEGRMKSPEYAAGVSYVYRKYVDIYLDKGKEYFYNYLEGNDYRNDMLDLMDLYNRGGFSEGYGRTYNGKSMMSMERPNHGGVLVGVVKGYDKGYADIGVYEDINAQDVLEIRSRRSEATYEITVKDDVQKNDAFRVRVGAGALKNQSGNKVGKKHKADIKIGDMVYRTRNNALLERIGDSYIKKNAKKDITGVLYAKSGERLRLTLSCDDKSVTAYHNSVEVAIKQPMTKDKLKASIDKLGDTMYQFKELVIDADDDIFVPVAWLNEIRREAVAMLSDAVIGAYRRELNDDRLSKADICEDILNEKEIENVRKDMNISAGISTDKQFETALAYPEISAIYVDYDSFSLDRIIQMAELANASEKAYYIILPHICRLSVYERLSRDTAALVSNNEISGFIIRNFEEAQLLQSILKDMGQHKRLRLNHNMYIFNRDAKRFWIDKGIDEFTAPVELNEKELRDLGLEDCELMVYGYLPVMVSVQCLHASTGGCNRCKPGEARMDYIVDRIGKKFFVRTNCASCYNIIYNGQRLSLLSYADRIKDLRPAGIRLDFTIESSEEMSTVISAYIDAFRYGRRAVLEFDNITAGHFRRGVE
ncbi:MAG: U32 family peptidase [Clostridiales bacterium]|nr:U32 family peptidase [Clostridiales bacterium]